MLSRLGIQNFLNEREKLGPIAQLVEQLTFNQLVPRSSRGRPTILQKPHYFLVVGLFLFVYELLTTLVKAF